MPITGISHATAQRQFRSRQAIPAAFAFGKRARAFALSDNHSPQLAWNDALRHRCHVHGYALNVAALPLFKGFTREQLRVAMAGHVLGEAALTGTYSLNPALTV